AEGKYIKQTGGHGQYGHVVLTVEPSEVGAGIVVVNAIKGGSVPREFIKPLEQGIKEAAGTGVLAGYEVKDVKITLIDGSYHEVDSSEIDFVIRTVQQGNFDRSEEHTSELQSRRDLVCRLLLEKKKKHKHKDYEEEETSQSEI